MAFKAQEIENLKKSVPVWVAAQQRMGGRLQQLGQEFKAPCPFHEEKTPSFTCYEQDGIWLYKCFGCGAAGNVFQFVMAFDKVDFNTAVEKVAQLAGWKEGRRVVEQTFQPAIATEKTFKTYTVDKLAKMEQDLANSAAAVAYLREQRGITLEIAKRFHLGFIQDASSLNHSHPNAKNGWIVFPYIQQGIVYLLKLRSIVAKEYLRFKGMNTVLYNTDTVEAFDDVMIVEGEFDALVLEQAGFPTVALPQVGYTLTTDDRELVQIANARYLAGDCDNGVGEMKMQKLWAELEKRTYRLRWPEGCKDANDFLLKVCNGDIEKFRLGVEALKSKARENPIPYFYNMKEVLLNADFTDPMKNPLRIHMPWKAVDEMAVITPQNVVSIYSNESGVGKTTWTLAPLLENAIHRGAVVYNYSAELSPQEYGALICSYLTGLDKNEKNEDMRRRSFIKAGELIGNAEFHVGFNPDAIKIEDVLDILEQAVRIRGANILCLDHLHFYTSGRKDSTAIEAAAMQRIKTIAVKYGVVFFVVGQSRKAQQGRVSRISGPAEAKGSGAYIDVANHAFQISRAAKTDIDPYNPPADRLVPETDIQVIKARPKGPGKAFARLMFRGNVARFFEMIPDLPPRNA